MAEMKNSGVAWINTIPKEWKLKKIKYALKNRNENNNPIRSKNILSLTAKQGVIPLEEKEGGGNKPKEDYSAYKLAYPNDIVMNSMNVLSGSVGLSKYFGCVSPVYYMLRPIDEKDDVRYYNYIFQTTVFQRSLLGLGNGILMKESDNGKLNTIRMRIPLDKLGNLLIPVPDSPIQKKIADYLDSIIPNIDMLLADIEKQIETLEEYKKSIITEAVTKGLDPDVEMKDSGIEWIGMIPKHWKIYRYKHLASLVRGGSPRPAGNPIYYYGDIPFMKVADITKDDRMYVDSCEGSIKPAGLSNTRMVSKGTLLLTNSGATLGVPKILNIDTTINDGIAAFLNLSNKLNIKFAYYSLKSKTEYFLQVAALGMGQPNLNTDIIGNTYVTIPPKYEQQKIIEFLDVKCAEIDGAIRDKKEQLETLEQYKKSVIYEYVTGKKEVQ